MDQLLLNSMRQSIVDGAPGKAATLAQNALAAGIDPLEIINDGFVSGIMLVGERYACREMFLPDLLASAEAMKAAVSVLEPEIRRRGAFGEVHCRLASDGGLVAHATSTYALL